MCKSSSTVRNEVDLALDALSLVEAPEIVTIGNAEINNDDHDNWHRHCNGFEMPSLSLSLTSTLDGHVNSRDIQLIFWRMEGWKNARTWHEKVRERRVLRLLACWQTAWAWYIQIRQWRYL
jgi:hypothetical protein